MWRGMLRLGCAPLVAVVKPANLRYCNDGAAVRRLHGPRFGCVLGQREVRPGFMIQPLNPTPIILNRAKSTTPGILGLVAVSGFTESASGACRGVSSGSRTLSAFVCRPLPAVLS
jgi:hypothetical protein